MLVNHQKSNQTQPTDLPERLIQLIVLAASLGGLDALSHVLGELPATFPVPLVVVQHICPDQPSYLAEILSRRTPLQVRQATEGELLQPSTVYTPVPGRHVLVQRHGLLALSRSPKVQFARPSADVLFESVASCYGDRAIAVVLTGAGCDGAQGVRTIRERGGFVIAQDESTSACFDMPNAAIETRQVDLILPLCQIAFALRTLVLDQECVRPARSISRT